jgi:hypothetical protein
LNNRIDEEVRKLKESVEGLNVVSSFLGGWEKIINILPG